MGWSDATAPHLLQTVTWGSTTIGLVLILFGATTVFAEFQSSLNQVWGVEANPRSALSGLRNVTASKASHTVVCESKELA